jgi:hypothetical protein
MPHDPFDRTWPSKQLEHTRRRDFITAAGEK